VINWLGKAVWLFILLFFVLTACESRLLLDKLGGQRPERELLAIGPDIETLTVAADYASHAVKATGGLDAWTKTKKLEFDGVVTFYHPDNSFYLTEHHFEVYPWSNSIRISAREPLTKFVWELTRGRFSVLQGDERADVSAMAVSYCDYAQAILSVVTAPVRLVDASVGFVKSPTPVKIEGLWYYPIEQTYLIERVTPDSIDKKDITPVERYWSKVVFFQNRDSSLVDMVWFADIEQKKFLAVRGYDYKQTREDGVLVPAKIEIFETDAQAVLKQRVVKIDFK